ncbi:MAG: response regulator transcription factor [Phycisphaerae bacterium]
MPNIPKQRIFFVDDEPKVQELVGETLEKAGFRVSCFASAADCLEKLRSHRCDLLITDVKLPGMSGLELLTEVKRFFPCLSVVVITGYGDIPMAVRAIKAGAADFIEKPLEKRTLLSAVKFALEPITATDPLLRRGLTRAEMRVLHLIMDGKTNKETARVLHRSMSTIEVHRKHIMRKLGVNNIVDLVKRATSMEIVDPPADE